MDEEHDYSRYKFCIAFVLDHHCLHSNIYEIGSYFEDGLNEWWKGKSTASIIYDTTSKTVISNDKYVNYSMSETEELPENWLYIPNVFTELYNTYEKHQEDHCERNWFYVVQQMAIKVLQGHANIRKQELNCSEAELCYVFTIPTGWNENIKEELIRPLFIKSGVLNEEDDQGRLIFFTDLELNFRYLQSRRFREFNVAMNQGHQYIIMSLYFQQEIRVNLNLVSAQYPSFKTVDSGYVPQLLKDFHFTISLRSHNVKSSLTTCLEKFCDSELVLKIIDQMLQILEETISRTYVERFRETMSDFILGRPLSYQPFFSINLEYAYDSKYGKKEFDLMINNIRSFTMGNVYEALIPSVAKSCMNGISTLLQGTDNIKSRSLVIFHTDDVNIDKRMVAVLGLVKKWSKTRSKQKDSPYELIGESIGDDQYFVYEFDATHRMKMASVFVRKHMNDYNIRRDPIILPRDSSNEEYGSCSKPVYFINIDLLPTKNKITLTYVDEKSRVKQIEDIRL
ncbi:uncharacterized protein EV154DRAFT_139599 [Mucor mucedo]|uniref:uncharacterized protein n=1 Tax=Mucor mucedo TaxID=29922 RepID=UPI00221E38FE|nr:uncharacterized protein EV154DRAFT_139599 [Mucor mucedo]KAI7893683.1 hypothetical protein EV154DRAFT_139599 [Mucor mucedo]